MNAKGICSGRGSRDSNVSSTDSLEAPCSLLRVQAQEDSPVKGISVLLLRDPDGSTRKSVRLKIRSQLSGVDIGQAFYART